MFALDFRFEAKLRYNWQVWASAGREAVASGVMCADRLCVYCRRQPVDPRWRPFCSERCKLLDLGNWVDERYRIPSTSETQDEAAETDRPDEDDD